jgi:hypothetical protein
MEVPAPSSPTCAVSAGGRSVPEAVGTESKSDKSEEVSGKNEMVSSSDGGSSVDHVGVVVILPRGTARGRSCAGASDRRRCTCRD